MKMERTRKAAGELAQTSRRTWKENGAQLKSIRQTSHDMFCSEMLSTPSTPRNLKEEASRLALRVAGPVELLCVCVDAFA